MTDVVGTFDVALNRILLSKLVLEEDVDDFVRLFNEDFDLVVLLVVLDACPRVVEVMATNEARRRACRLAATPCIAALVVAPAGDTIHMHLNQCGMW